MTGVGASGVVRQETADGAILFDAHALAQGERFDPRWFDAGFWRGQHGATEAPGGRGGIVFAHTPNGDWALRHYRRGGLFARVLGDRYLWNGAERTRSFSEFRLLHDLVARGFDVSQPVAVRYRRQGLFYSADLITRFIPQTTTLAWRIQRNEIDSPTLARVGEAIAKLHAAGVFHADLNAHNVLIGADKIWLIDFDRGELRAPARDWQLANIARLKRSCQKIMCSNAGHEVHVRIQEFERTLWRPLVIAYEKALTA